MRDRDDSKPRARGEAVETDVTPLDDAQTVREESAMEVVPEDSGAAPEKPSSPVAEQPPPPPADPSLEEVAARALEQIRTLRSERDRLYDSWLRATADFENYRKRTEREREEFSGYAIESLVLQILPVLDNFQRALDSLPPETPRGFTEGVTLIYKMLGDVLAKQGVVVIPAEGEIFDPHLHDAVETEVRTDLPHHRILAERLRGYRIGRRVLRPARVRVAVRPDGDEDARAETSPDAGGPGEADGDARLGRASGEA